MCMQHAHSSQCECVQITQSDLVFNHLFHAPAELLADQGHTKAHAGICSSMMKLLLKLHQRWLLD